MAAALDEAEEKVTSGEWKCKSDGDEVGNKPVKLEEPGLANKKIGRNPVQGSCNFTANIGTRSNVGDNLCRSILISLLKKSF